MKSGSGQLALFVKVSDQGFLTEILQTDLQFSGWPDLIVSLTIYIENIFYPFQETISLNTNKITNKKRL